MFLPLTQSFKALILAFTVQLDIFDEKWVMRVEEEKWAIFPVISGTNDKYMIITDLKWMKDCELPIYGIIQTTLV